MVSPNYQPLNPTAPQLNVTVEKEVAGFWVRVPCLEKLGSCHYPDACALLDELTPPGQDCPPPLSVYQLPCRCPFKKVSPPTFYFFFLNYSLFPASFRKGFGFLLSDIGQEIQVLFFVVFYWFGMQAKV